MCCIFTMEYYLARTKLSSIYHIKPGMVIYTMVHTQVVVVEVKIVMVMIVVVVGGECGEGGGRGGGGGGGSINRGGGGVILKANWVDGLNIIGKAFGVDVTIEKHSRSCCRLS